MESRELIRANSREYNGCWLWTRALFQKSGYAMIGLQGRVRSAHRVSFEAFKGPIPDGMLVRHTCHNRACVNPDHLVLGTHRDNYADARSAGRNTRGAIQGSAKLTEDVVIAIRRAYAAGAKQSALAREYDVDITNISLIVRGKSWAHCGGPIMPLRRNWRKGRKGPHS